MRLAWVEIRCKYKMHTEKKKNAHWIPGFSIKNEKYLLNHQVLCMIIC